MDNTTLIIVLVLATLGILSAICTYVLYLKKKERDTSSIKNENKRDVFKTINIAIVVITLTFLCMMFIYGTREPRIEFSDNGIRIRSIYGTIVRFSGVSGIYLLPEKMASIGIGNQISAFNLGVIKRGNFESGQLFVHVMSEPTIQIVRERGTSIFISFRNSERTEELYRQLEEAFTNFSALE